MIAAIAPLVAVLHLPAGGLLGLGVATLAGALVYATFPLMIVGLLRQEIFRSRKSRMSAMISGPCVSRAKCPASRRWISASGRSRA
jgi:hypothetical protein